jgi:hypothetical protein
MIDIVLQQCLELFGGVTGVGGIVLCLTVDDDGGVRITVTVIIIRTNINVNISSCIQVLSNLKSRDMNLKL